MGKTVDEAIEHGFITEINSNKYPTHNTWSVNMACANEQGKVTTHKLTLSSITNCRVECLDCGNTQDAPIRFEGDALSEMRKIATDIKVHHSGKGGFSVSGKLRNKP